MFFIVFSSCSKTTDKRGYEADFSEFFKSDSGSFVLYDFNNKYNIFYREAEANKEYSPAQTYNYITVLSNVINSRKDSLGTADLTALNEQKKIIKNYGYGNTDTSFSPGNYTCGGVLKISTSEQCNFIKKVYSNEINIPQEKLDTFKSYFVTDTVNHRRVSYINGECTGNDGNKINWCVGTVEFGTNLYVFALNLINGSDARAKEITQNILYRFRIVEPVQ